MPTAPYYLESVPIVLKFWYVTTEMTDQNWIFLSVIFKIQSNQEPSIFNQTKFN